MTKNNRLPNLICAIILFFMLASVIIFATEKKNKDDFSFDDKSIYNWNDEWEVSYDNEKLENQTVPLTVPLEVGKSVLLKKTLPKTIKKYNCVLIEGNRQDIVVSVGGILRESFSDKEGRKYGKTSPSAYLIVPIYSTDAGMDITVRLSTMSSEYTGRINDIFLGNEMSIILMIIKSNILWIICAIIILVTGAVAYVSFHTYRLAFERGTSYIYIFVYALLAAIWYFSSLPIRQFLVGNLALIDSVGYCCYMFSPLALILYFHNITNRKYNNVLMLLAGVVFTNYFVQNVLHITGYFEFNEMKIVTQMICLIVIIILLGAYISFCENENIKLSKWTVAGYVCLATWNFTVVICFGIAAVNIIYDLYGVAAIVYLCTNMIDILSEINKEQKLRKDAESASKAKSLFLANMSHEIRTPINAVLGMNELILRDASEPAIRGYSVNIAEAGKSLLALVNDILDFSKIESGKMDIIPTEYKMKVLLNDLILMTESRMSGKELELKLDIDESIPSVYYGDEVRIKQVITNILTNAVKYTKQGTVTLNVSMNERKDDYAILRFSVSDTGKGIKPEDLKMLMSSSFNRVNDEENRTIEGTGLGLSITRQLLELMDTELEVTSEFGKGSTFAFNIKQKVVDSSEMGSVHEKEKQTVKRKNTFKAPEAKLLVVDDVKMNLMVLKGLLKSYEIKPETCDSGQACIDICKENEFDVILLDHMMPEMDGIETFKRLKGEKLIPDKTKVIVLTANAVMGASEMYTETGFDAYMTKPVDIAELDKTLKKFLGDLVIPLSNEE